MKISIIVPVYNAGIYLEHAVQSLMSNATEGHQFEILLVDDRSTDELTLHLLAKLEKNPMVSVLRQTVNGGPAKARNAGLRAATGDWVGFLDADDLMAPGTMEFRIKIISEMPDARWIVGNVLELRQEGVLSDSDHFSKMREVGKKIADDIFFLPKPTQEMLTWNILPVLGAMLIRKDVFIETEYLAEELTYGEDIHFCLVISAHAELYWTSRPCLHLRRHHDSLTKDVFRGAKAMPKASLMLLKDKRFRNFRKQLRWQHAANLRRLSMEHLKRGQRANALLTTLLAIRWVPNDSRNFKNLLKISLLSEKRLMEI